MKLLNPTVSGSLTISGSTHISGQVSASTFVGDGSGLVGVTSYTDSDTLSYINTLGVVSSSAQLSTEISGAFVSTSASLASDISTNDGRLTTLEGKTLVSGSSQINFASISNKPTLVSSSSQISFSGITGKPILVSGSSQIIYNQISNIPSGIISSSNQLSNQTIPGDLTVGGILTAQEFHTEFISASIIYDSGSTQFGNSLDDIHNFSGSLAVNTNNLFVSGGNVGIGTTSPQNKLDVNGTGRFSGSVTGNSFIPNSSTIPTNGMFLPTTNALGFSTNGSQKMRIDASGNMGLGVTPNDWGGDAKGIQITNYGNVSGNYTTGIVSLASNAYESANNTWNRVNGTSAGLYQVSYTGAHSWLYTGPAVAGSAISWTQAMTLDANGNLGLGVTPSASSVKTFEISGVGNALSGFGVGDIALMSNAYYDNAFKYAGSNLAASYRLQDGIHKWNIATSGTAGNPITFTQAMTLDASGRLGIGTSSPNNLLALYSASSEIYTQWVQSGTGTSSTDGLRIGLDASSNGIINLNEGTALITSVNGSERMRITNSGNVGIGTTSPGATLDVAGALNNGKSIIRVTNTDTSNYITIGAGIPGISNAGMNFTLDGTSKMVIDASGNVGIGTTSPSGKLDVNDGEIHMSGPAGGIRRTGDQDLILFAATAGRGLSVYTNNDGGGPKMVVSAAGNVGIGTTNPLNKLHVVGGSISIDADQAIRKAGDNYIIGYSSTLPGIAVGSGTATDMVAINAGGQERFRITTTGNVGIGTTSPSYKLDVNGVVSSVASASTMLLNRTGGDTYGAGVKYQTSGTDNWVVGTGQTTVGTDYQIYNYGLSAGALAISYSSNNVGIGTTSPTAKLQVLGDLKIDPVGLDVGGYNFYSQTVSGAIGILGHNLRASASTANQVNVVNSGWYSSMIKQYYSEGITFHTSTTLYNAGDVYPIAATERMRITPAGNVGIGTPAPDGKLDVNGLSYFRDDIILYGTKKLYLDSGSDTYLTEVSANTMQFVTGGSERMIITSGGNVGIGTTSPTNKLEVEGVIKSSQGIYSGGLLEFTNAWSASPYNPSSWIRAASGTGLFLVNNSISKWAGFTSTNDFIINNGDIYVNAASTSVGIGTTNPSAKLDVNGKTIVGSNSSNALEVFSDGDTEIGFSYATKGNIYAKIIGDVTTASPLGGEIAFQTATGGTLSERMRITSDGNLLVGTTNADVGGSVTGINLRPAGIVQASNNLTGIFSAPFYSDRRGTNNTGPAYTLAMGGFLKADIGIDGTNATTNDASITFNTIYANTSRSERMRITSAGNVGIGTTSPSYKLHVNGSVAGVGAYNNLSDVNWKKNIQDITYGVDKILQLKPITFNWLNEDYGDRLNIGFIAQEVEEIIPNIVTTAEDGTKSLAITDLIPVLTKAIQEQQAIIENQNTKITELETALQALITRVEQLENQ